MPRYLVTGALGFIGSNLVRRLCEDGAEVLALDSLRTGKRINAEGLSCEIREHDVTRPFDFGGEWDAVFHHGDITDPRYEGADLYDRNVGGFSNVLEFCRRKSARLIFASTAGLYGNGAVPMREDTPILSITEYGRSKKRMEELGLEASRQLPVIGLRYFNVFGPGETHKGRAASMVLHLARQIASGGRPRLFKYGEQARDFIYIDDVVDANLCALTAPSGIYNVGTGIATTFKDIAIAVQKAMKDTSEVEYFDMPYDPSSYQHITQADTVAAKTKLGFTSRWEVPAAVNDYVDWMKAKGVLVS